MFPSGLDGIAPLSLVAIAATALIAGLARGFSGFGAALIFMPLASAAVGPKVAAAVLLVVDTVMSVGMYPSAWRLADRKEAAVMAAGALLGVPAGTWLLAQSDPVAVRWAVAALVFVLLALLMSGWRYRAKPKPPLTVAVGVASGLGSGLAQVGGPPVVAYWLGGASDPARVRANIVLYFLLSSVISVVSYLAGGLLTLGVLGLALVTGPLYGLGLWLGSHLFGRASELAFRRICYALIAVAGLLGLPALDGVLR